MVESGDGTPAERAASPDEERSWRDFAVLYDAHEARLYRFARLLLPGQDSLAEDAVAETFIHVHCAWMDGRVHDFFGYARQTLVDHVLGLFRDDQTAARELALVAGAGGPGERQVGDPVADTRAVFDALATLPDRGRTAVVLRYYEDLAYDDIAAMMATSEDGVRAHVVTGLAQLRQLIASSPA